MRKLGLIAAIAGIGFLGADLLLRLLVHASSWLWLPGFLALAGGGALVVWARNSSVAPVVPAPKASAVPGTETARLLDNFEQRFAELKGRNASDAVVGDLYALGNQLELRGRTVQASAVYRHLARIDNTYRDVSVRLKRLMDADRVKPKPAPAPEPAALAAAPVSQSAGNGKEPQRLGRYVLEREIGRGAMGTVYLGRDTAINRQVAIKAIPLAAEFSDGELVEARSRFFREAETAGRLNHPNIVTIYDVGEERGLAYIAMEYLKGRHLSDFAAPSTLMDARKVLEIVAQAAEALGSPTSSRSSTATSSRRTSCMTPARTCSKSRISGLRA